MKEPKECSTENAVNCLSRCNWFLMGGHQRLHCCMAQIHSKTSIWLECFFSWTRPPWFSKLRDLVLWTWSRQIPLVYATSADLSLQAGLGKNLTNTHTRNTVCFNLLPEDNVSPRLNANYKALLTVGLMTSSSGIHASAQRYPLCKAPYLKASPSVYRPFPYLSLHHQLLKTRPGRMGTQGEKELWVWEFNHILWA